MLCHLRFPFKVELSGDAVRLWWETRELTAGVGFEAAYRLAGETKDVEPGPDLKRRVRAVSAGVYRVEDEMPGLSGRFVWTVTLRENHTVTLDMALELRRPEEARRIESVRVGLVAAGFFDRWFVPGGGGAFVPERTEQTAWQGSGAAFCLGLASEEGPEAPALLFESLNNAAHPVFSRIERRGLGGRAEHRLSFTVGRAGLDALARGGVFPLSRVVATDRLDVLRRFVDRNRRPGIAPVREHLRASEQAPRRRVVLANPPWVKNGVWGVRAGSRWAHLKDPTEDRYLPLPFFLSYAKALLTYYGYEAYLMDSQACRTRDEDFVRQVNALRPDLLVVETSTPSLENDLALLSGLSPEIRVVLCGPVLELEDPAFWTRNPRVAFALPGEYEDSLLHLVAALERGQDLGGVAGLLYRGADGTLRRTAARPLMDLAWLPWPDRETLPYFEYWDLVGDIPEPSAQMHSSRGCPFRCTFCLWPQLMYRGRNYRRRASADVVDEMEYLVRVMGYRSVYFDDDTSNIGRSRWLALCGDIVRRGLQEIPWAMMARADLMDGALLAALRGAGLCAVKYGVESTSQALIDQVGKQMRLPRVFEALEETRRLGIRVHLTFTLGLPGETRETLLKTVQDALRLDPHSVQFSINTPYPGTEIYRTWADRGQLVAASPGSQFDGHAGGVVQTEHWSPAQLRRAKDEAYAAWNAHRRRGRGWAENVRRFVAYSHKYSPGRAVQVAAVTLYTRGLLRAFFAFEQWRWPQRDRACSGVTLWADTFIRGNVNARRHRFGRHVIIDGGHHYAQAEYDFVVRRSTMYHLYAQYAGEGFRPVEITLDGVPLKKRALLGRTGGWTRRHMRTVKELSVYVEQGKHTLGIYSPGLIPHIRKFVFRAADQDEAWVDEPPESLMTEFFHWLWDRTLQADFRVLAPGLLLESFKALYRRRVRAPAPPDELMLAGIRDGQAALTGPEHVVVDLTNRCGLRCASCWLHSPLLREGDVKPEWLTQQLPGDVAARLLDDLAQIGTRRVRFTGGGEPLLHPDLLPLLRRAKSRGLIASLTTSLFPFDPETMRELAAAEVDEITVSVSAATPEGYAHLHPGCSASEFARARGCLETLASARMRATQLVISHVVTPHTVSQLPDLLRMARDLGADGVYFTLADTRPGRTDSLRLSAQEARGALELARTMVAESGRKPELLYFEDGFLRRLQALPEWADRCDKPRTDALPCFMGWYFARVLADGSVVPCCRAVHHVMGSVREQRFPDVWFGRAYNEFRWKSKHLPKTDPYFAGVGCDRQCDNLMHNEQIAARLRDSGDGRGG